MDEANNHFFSIDVPATRIFVRGLVQGVGFRPFIYRIATEAGYKGWVENRTDGVIIVLQVTEDVARSFVETMKQRAPLASDIFATDIEAWTISPLDNFSIRPSRESSGEITEISPDIAVCAECMADIQKQPHRMHYPLVNCTHCGPRFSIISSLPYDRPFTTMAPFPMCAKCLEEYSDISNRRFHAQPVACNHCGPGYRFRDRHGLVTEAGIGILMEKVAALIEAGKSVLVKGMGGYHLMCDATNPMAVAGLRARKQRDGKPFALMVRDLDAIKKIALVDKSEELLLTSWRRPIVLLESRGNLPPTLNSNLNALGVVLPYMPAHHLLFELLKTPVLVFTSGNVSDKPVEINDEQAEKNLGGMASGCLFYNRSIYNRVDDSVAAVIDDKPCVFRRSRGYAPKPVRLDFQVDGIFAAGAELKNTFCVGKGNQAVMSQHIGDLKNYETHRFYQESVRRFGALFRFTPTLAVADLHPDYLSTRFAEGLGLPIERVQHHHAHIASCMAEHHLVSSVIGLAFDGTGLGDDGHLWGSEVMIADLHGYKRINHLEYFALPGGDKATKEPWRIALGLLKSAFGNEAAGLAQRLMPQVPDESVSCVIEALQKKINISYSSGMGRLFDAIAALAGLCVIPEFEAEGPMRLEACADKSEKGTYPVQINGVLFLNPMIESLVNDLIKGVSADIVSARFHNTMVAYAERVATQIRSETGIKDVVLSGGVFQNRYLCKKLIDALRNQKFYTFNQSQVPCNDGGISLGQISVAATRRNNLCV